MAWFEYEGMTPGGTAITGQLEAVDREQAAEDLAQMQIEVRVLGAAMRRALADRPLAADKRPFRGTSPNPSSTQFPNATRRLRLCKSKWLVLP